MQAGLARREALPHSRLSILTNSRSHHAAGQTEELGGSIARFARSYRRCGETAAKAKRRREAGDQALLPWRSVYPALFLVICCAIFIPKLFESAP
jgi:hypothetical protein